MQAEDLARIGAGYWRMKDIPPRPAGPPAAASDEQKRRAYLMRLAREVDRRAFIQKVRDKAVFLTRIRRSEAEYKAALWQGVQN